MRKEKKLIIIDTASENLKLWLSEEDQVMEQREKTNEAALGRQILRELDDMMKKSSWRWQEIDRIAVHGGPGAKSSALRAGIVVATVLGLSLEIVVVEVEGHGNLVKQALKARPMEVVRANYI